VAIRGGIVAISAIDCFIYELRFTFSLTVRRQSGPLGNFFGNGRVVTIV